MRAAIVSEYQVPPTAGDRHGPQAGDGKALVELRAAALNPADLAIASGSFPAGSPPLPYVPGIEGVGTVIESARFRPERGCGRRAVGSVSERTARSRSSFRPSTTFSSRCRREPTISLPPRWAWSVSRHGCRSRGSPRFARANPFSFSAPPATSEASPSKPPRSWVRTASSPSAETRTGWRRARALGADETVEFGGDDFRERLASTVDGAAPTLVVDTLWGAPLEAAAAVAAPGARIVHVGQASGPMATIASGLMRGKQLQILGYSNFAVPQSAVAQAYADVVEHAAAGRISIDVESVPLEQAAAAWTRQAEGSGTKLVLVP